MILTAQESIKRVGAEGGSIINLSSIVGSHPVPGALRDASTKGAIETLTRGLALELAPRKIRVNALAPGHTETEGNMAARTFESGAGAVLVRKTPLGTLFPSTPNSTWAPDKSPTEIAFGFVRPLVAAHQPELAINHPVQRAAIMVWHEVLTAIAPNGQVVTVSA